MLLTAPRFQDFWMLFPLMVVGFWLGGCFLISCMGWRWFARKYPAQTKVQPEGTVHLVPSVKFEFIGSYRNSVRAVITKEGIYFSVPFMFVFHAPFLLPWKSVRRIRKKAGFRQRGKRLIVEVEDAEGPIRLLLSKAMEEDFLKYYWPQKPKPVARRAFPKEDEQEQENAEEESVGATVGVAENVNGNANANPSAGIDAEVKTIPGTYPSLFTIVGIDMGMHDGGSSSEAQAPVVSGAPVYAKAAAAASVPVAAPVAAPAPPPLPMPVRTPAPAPPLAPEATVNFYIPKTVSVPVPVLATITAAVAAATLMAEPRS